MKKLKILAKTAAFILKMIPAIPSLFYRKHKGAKAFAKELKKAGINKDATSILTKEYKQYSSFFLNLIQDQVGNKTSRSFPDRDIEV